MRVALAVLVLVGCAPSRRPANCDPSAPGCPAVDAATGSDASIADAPPDAPRRGFGSPCTTGAQCDSDICIQVSTGAVCTKLCGDCPDGWGCVEVVGAVEPGVAASVCVPSSNQLCSPCQLDSECTLLGMDKCLVEPTGRRYCGRDCSIAACPAGYDCQNQVIDSVNYKQCVPQSQACDCRSALQSGAIDSCAIPNALGTSCAGTRTCGGTAGWGACQPPSQVDVPDATYTDDNCDGIDGDITQGIFVASNGEDGAACGMTFDAPCLTISHAIARAVDAGRPNVYVQKGTYHETVVMRGGVSVWGGYDLRWQRGPYSDPAHAVTVIGQSDVAAGGEGEFITVRAHGIGPATIADLVLQGPSPTAAGGVSGRDGLSSYAVHAQAAQLSLVRVLIVAGSGAPGGTGGTGAGAPAVDPQPGMAGGNGGNGNQGTSVCDSSAHGAGGTAGVNTTCPGDASKGLRLTGGGGGGDGGHKDRDCSIIPDLTATAGFKGDPAAFVLDPFGLGGPGGTGGGACGATGSGDGGLAVNGAGGTAFVGAGYLVAPNGHLYWYARSGNAGGTGENGSGGGGGGGGGGCDNNTDAYGAGGGGGGAGGCAALGGGGGGGGGGGSFGIFAVGGSAITVASCTLVRGVGGAGGPGGIGGRGQTGGAAGSGGAVHPNTATPGNGGKGAHGGHGGGGAGGQGGHAAGILRTPDSAINGTCSQSQGAAGLGGTGGASAPTAPDHDGSPGQGGAAGSLVDALICADPSNC